MNRDEIAAARRALGLTVAEAARLVCGSAESWRKWERGNSSPTAAHDERIRLALRRRADAIERARRVIRGGRAIAIPAGDPRALAAAGTAQMLEGHGRILVQHEAPPTPTE